MAEAAKVVSSGQARRPGADDRDRRLVRLLDRLKGATAEGGLRHEEAFKRPKTHRGVDLTTPAVLLAQPLADVPAH
jgi:hypothetical protein